MQLKKQKEDEKNHQICTVNKIKNMFDYSTISINTLLIPACFIHNYRKLCTIYSINLLLVLRERFVQI